MTYERGLSPREWERRSLMSVTRLVKFYGLDKDLIRKALEIYTRNEIKKRPSDISSEMVSRQERHLAWIRYHASSIRDTLERSSSSPKGGVEVEESRKISTAITAKKWRCDRALPPCLNCAALDHGESSKLCPWKSKKGIWKSDPSRFAEYWSRKPDAVSKALDRYMTWGQGSRLDDERQFHFRYEVMRQCTPEREELEVPLEVLQAEVKEILLNREGMNCMLCGSHDHKDGARDTNGRLVCPFSLDGEPGSRWPDPYRIALASGFKDDIAKQIIHDYYLRAMYYFDTALIDDVEEDASQMCYDANNMGFKRTSFDRNICLIEDGSDSEEPNDS